MDQQQSENLDVYGFVKKNDEIDKVKQKDKLKQTNARIEKWRKMMPNIPKLLNSNDEKLKSRLRKGIPEGVRMLIWPLLAEVNEMKIKSKVNYQELLSSDTVSPYENQIQLDIVRTFQENHLFTSTSLTSNSLYNVLRAISLSFEKMGYCQGLNFLTGCFLLVMNDEMVFWHIYSILTKYEYIDIYINPIYSFKYLYILQSLLILFLPEIVQKFKQLNIETIFYAAEWFITLFSSILPIKLFLRVMDVFWMEKLKVIFRVALAILKIRKEEILNAKTFEQCMKILKDFDFFQNYDQDKFMKIVSKDFVFSKDFLKKICDQYDAKQKQEEQNKQKQSQKQ